MASRIIGCGGYLPKKIVSNDDLSKKVDTSDEWIRSRTGITQRHVAGDNEQTLHMAYEAALAAIADARNMPKDDLDSILDTGKVNPSEFGLDIDLVIVCTNTPDQAFPSVANKLQWFLNLEKTPSFDLQAICSGFVYGLNVADNMIKSGQYKTVLVVCADKMSSLLDWEDRSTCVLFGDGAGAVILQQDSSGAGIIDSNIYSDGSMHDILYTDDKGVQMKGQEVFKRAVVIMPEAVQELLDKHNLKTSDIDYLIPHQANLRIINNIIERFGIDEKKVVTTVQKHANCSAASIPLALSELKASGKLKPGNLLAFTAFGAGATWGAALVRW